MADMPQADEEILSEGDAPAAGPAPRRGPGHRAADARDTAAEMAARAHEISLEAGSKMAGAMRDVIGAAAGFSAFAIESARDLVHYMVRRGQMGQEEGDVLIQQAEAAYIAKHGALPKPEPKPAPPKPIPLGQLPKAVTAPAAAAEAALEARAAMRLEPQRPSEKGPLLVLKPAAPKPAPKVVEKIESAPVVVEKAPAKAATPPKADKVAPKAAEKAPSKAAAKAPEKPVVVAKPAVKAPVKVAATKAPAKPVAKAPAKPAAKAPAKAPAKPAPKTAAKKVAKKK
jgi:polyhydroxyalkanoate synthesis regulator phasin